MTPRLIEQKLEDAYQSGYATGHHDATRGTGRAAMGWIIALAGAAMGWIARGLF